MSERRIFERNRLHVVRVDLDAAARRVEQARDHADERRLAASGAPDDAQHLARFEVERHAREHVAAWPRVGVADAVERNRAFDLRDAHVGLLGVADGGFGPQDRRQPVHRRGGALHHRDDEAQRRDRPRHQGDVDDELGDVADRDHALDDQPSALPNDQNRRDADQNRKNRTPDRTDERQRQVALLEESALLGERVALGPLPRVGLDDANARQRLLHPARQARVLLLNRLRPAELHPRHEIDRDSQQRHRRECPPRQRRRDDEHERERQRDARDRAGHVHERRARVAPHLLDVGRGARHHVAGRERVVERLG